MLYHINRMKDKNHSTFSVDAEKVLGKIQPPFMIKTLNRLDIERMYFNIIKTTCDKPTANTITNSETMKSFPLRLRTK